MQNPAIKAVDYIPAVVTKLDKFGGVPKQWGNLYEVGRLRFLLNQMDSVEDVIQEVSALVLEYFSSGPRQEKRVAKLFEAGDGEASPMLSVKAINMALNHMQFDFGQEIPADPGSLPSPIARPGPDPAWSTEMGDKIWDLVAEGKLETLEARAMLKYWDLNNPDDWDILAELLQLDSPETAKHLVGSASDKIAQAAV